MTRILEFAESNQPEIQTKSSYNNDLRYSLKISSKIH